MLTCSPHGLSMASAGRATNCHPSLVLAVAWQSEMLNVRRMACAQLLTTKVLLICFSDVSLVPVGWVVYYVSLAVTWFPRPALNRKRNEWQEVFLSLGRSACANQSTFGSCNDWRGLHCFDF